MLICLSPHLDDAVLSCGGSIAARTRAGEEVLVATLFSAAAGAAEAEWAARRTEDTAALGHLGARALHLGLPDAPFRDPRWRGYFGLVFAALPDEAILDEAQEKVAALLAAHPTAEVWAPLGAGGHVDHRLTHAAARASGRPLSLYEDRPYALQARRVAARFRQLGAAPVAWGPPPAEAGEGFLARFFADEEDRRLAGARLAEEDAGLGADDTRATAWRLEGVVWTRVEAPLDDADRAALARAVDAYPSQRAFLLGDGDLAGLYGPAIQAEVRWAPAPR